MSIIKLVASANASTDVSPYATPPMGPPERRSILAESLEDYHYEGMIRLAAIDGRLHLGDQFDEDYDYTNAEVGRGVCGVVRVVERVGGRKFEGEINPLRCVKSSRKSSRVGKDPEEIEEALKREYSIYLSVDHPNIARLVDVYEDQFHVTMVMEYCLGGTLESRIQNSGRLPEARAKVWFSQLLLAVRHLHFKEVAHRDVKPLNCVFTDESESAVLKLIDFDASATCPDLDTGDMLRGQAGTPSFMSPEMFDSLEDMGKYYDTKTDLWSTGVTLFKMLCGKEPFTAPPFVLQSPNDSEDASDFLDEGWVKEIRNGNWSFKEEVWPTISEDAKDLIRQLLVVLPDRRPAAMQALSHKWVKPVHDLRASNSLASEEIGRDMLNALACFCEVSDKLRYSLQKLCYSKVDFDMQRILPIFALFDRKAQGCIDLEDFTSALLHARAGITGAQCAHLFDRLLGCFEEKAGTGSTRRSRLQFSEFMAAVLPIITMPSFVAAETDGHGIGLSVLDIEQDLRMAFGLDPGSPEKRARF